MTTIEVLAANLLKQIHDKDEELREYKRKLQKALGSWWDDRNDNQPADSSAWIDKGDELEMVQKLVNKLSELMKDEKKTGDDESNILNPDPILENHEVPEYEFTTKTKEKWFTIFIFIKGRMKKKYIRISAYETGALMGEIFCEVPAKYRYSAWIVPQEGTKIHTAFNGDYHLSQDGRLCKIENNKK